MLDKGHELAAVSWYDVKTRRRDVRHRSLPRDICRVSHGKGDFGAVGRPAQRERFVWDRGKRLARSVGDGQDKNLTIC